MSSHPGQAVQGTGLAFIVYTEAIKNMEVSQLWSVLYFFMLLMLGIGSMLGNTAAILTPLTDSKIISSHLPKEAISGQQASQWRGRGSGGPGHGSEQGRVPSGVVRGLQPPHHGPATSSHNPGPGPHDSSCAFHSPHHREVKWPPRPNSPT